MRSLLQATKLLSSLFSLASAGLLPTPSASDPSTFDITTVAGTTGPDHVSIHFQAPCRGCFIGTEDGLELELVIDAAHAECSGVYPRLNGVPLQSSTQHDQHRGDVAFTTKLSNGLGDREIKATWDFACLKGDASIISVQFHGIDSQDSIKTTSGFTASFRQAGQPLVIRLQANPVLHLDDPEIHDSWLQPQEHQRVVISSSIPHPILDSATALEHELNKLTALKDHVSVLREQIHETEHHIMLLLRAEFKSCSSLKCLFQTAKRKAPDLARLIASHWRHHTNRHEFSNHKAYQDYTEDVVVDETLEQTMVQHDQDAFPDGIALAEIAHVISTPARIDLHLEAASDPSPAAGDEPRPPMANHPGFQHPPSPPFPAADGQLPPWAHHPGRPPFPHQDLPHPPFRAGFNGRPQLQPLVQSSHHQLKYHLLAAVAILFTIVLGITLLIICIRNKTRLFCDPRRRADRAALREERKTKRLYRKAACKYKWAQFLDRLRRPAATADYEEKREMILEQEGVIEDVMQREITNLRTAHELVGELVRAEEGRARLYYQANFTPSQHRYTPAESDAGVGSSDRSESLPAYAAPPPRYDEELTGDIEIVDGFTGYAASNSDATTDSSVVDCSPRLSFETQRTTFTKRSHD